jgi:malate dehydrogenase (oxaloacetate-decarboxylating)(NADP+)
LDCGATTITDRMEVAAVHALAELAQAEQSDVVAAAYAGTSLSFGPDYLIPKPFDPRLMMRVAPAVARAAQESGVAVRPITDLEAYREKLQTFVYASGTTMKPIFTLAKRAVRKKVVFCEGEEERVLRAVQVVVDENLARPTLIGRPAVIAQRCEKFGPRLQAERDYDVVNTEHDHRYRDYWQTYHRLTERKGVTAQLAKIEMRRRLTLIGAMMIHRGHADGMLCGTFGTHELHRQYVDQVIGLRRGARVYAAMNAVVLPGRTFFIADTYVNVDPSAEQVAEITLLAAEEIRRFGITPKVALLSHSSFGSSSHPQAKKMQAALALLSAMDPELEVEGEMHGDAALSEEVRRFAFPDSRLKGEANLLIMPTVDAANIAFNLLKVAAGGGVTLGPILLGVAKPVHILTPSATVRRIVNMTALTVVDANVERPQGPPG